MSECDENRDRELARDILRYLFTHSEAKDTLQGIAQWWLLREWTERRLQDVERAIVLLEKAGLVLKKVQSGQEPRYAMNPTRKSEIKRLLQGAADD